MIIKRYWHFRYLDQRFSGRPYKWPKNEAILNFPFENIWWNIDSYIVAELIESMLRRCLREKKNLSWTLSALDLCMCTLFGSDLLEFAWVIVCPMLCDASTEYKFTCVCVCRCVCLLGWLRGTGTVVVCRTLVFDRRTFAVLRLTVRPVANGWPICG